MTVVCTYTPPQGQDIAPYLTALLTIIESLNNYSNNKDFALKNIQKLIDELDAVINAAKASTK